MKTQYAAINDVEAVARDIACLSAGRLVLVFDPKSGWCAADEVLEMADDKSLGTTTLTVKLQSDLYREHLAHALSALGAVRFLGPSAMSKLFRKVVPVKAREVTATPPSAGARAPEAHGKPSPTSSAASSKGKAQPSTKKTTAAGKR